MILGVRCGVGGLGEGGRREKWREGYEVGKWGGGGGG